jgi:prevent-host-death family protein
MKATILDLRYNMKNVLRALERGEEVTILHRGTPKGVIRPIKKQEPEDMRKHPLFGSLKSEQSVDEIMHDLRGGRYRDL